MGTLQDAMHDLGQQAVHQLASLGVILAALEDLPLDRQRTLHVLGPSVQANGSQGALPMVERQGAAPCWAEAKLHGQDHTQRGSQVAQDWGLPKQIVLAVAGHHDMARRAFNTGGSGAVAGDLKCASDHRLGEQTLGQTRGELDRLCEHVQFVVGQLDLRAVRCCEQ